MMARRMMRKYHVRCRAGKRWRLLQSLTYRYQLL